MEPAGRVHCLPLHHRHCSGGDPGSGVPHQPHHHPRHAGPQDRPGPQAAQDGQGYPGSARHCHAGIAAGRLSPPVMKNILLHPYICYLGWEPWPSILLTVFHFCRPWCGAFWKTW